MPCELCNWGDRADEGVLVAFEAGVFLQTEDGAISEDGLVEDLQKQVSAPIKREWSWVFTDLQEVNPDKNHQNH